MDNSLRIGTSSPYLMTASGRPSSCDTPEHVELWVGNSLDTLTWLEAPMSLADLQKGSSSFIVP